MEGIYTYKLIEKLIDEIESKNRLARELDKKAHEKELSQNEMQIDKLTEMLAKIAREHRTLKHKILELAFYEHSFGYDNPKENEIHENYKDYFMFHVEKRDDILKLFSEVDLVDFLLEKSTKLNERKVKEDE